MLKRLDWSKRKMRYVFALCSAFLVFPAFIPITITAAIVPNITLLGLSLFNGHILSVFVLYFKAWYLFLPSYLISFIIMLGISQMIFFEYRGNHGR
jgi:hypothetical protein